MGMDQYIQTIRPLTNDEIAKIAGKNTRTIDWVLENDYSIDAIPCSDVEEITRNKAAIGVYQKVSMKTYKMNYQKLKKHEHIPEDYEICGVRSTLCDEIEYTFAPPGKASNTATEDEKMRATVCRIYGNEAFFFEEEIEEDFLVAAKRDIAEYRENKTIHELIQEKNGPIQNCIPVLLDKKDLLAISDYAPITIGPLQENEIITYKAWW